MRYKPTREERLEDLKRRALPAISALIVLGVGGWVAWHEWVQAPPAPEGVAVAIAPKSKLAAAVAKMSAEVDGLEQQARRLELTAADPAERDAVLSAAIGRQREIVELGPGVGREPGARLARLERERAALRARVAERQSEALEAQAQDLLGTNQREGAIDLLREALRLQREADANAPPDTVRDLPREAQLAATITDLEAEPLHDLIVAARQRGAEAMSGGGNPAAARQAYSEARDLQAELNRRFPESSYADIAAIDELTAAMAAADGAAPADEAAAPPAGETAARIGPPAVTAKVRDRARAAPGEAERQTPAQPSRAAGAAGQAGDAPRDRAGEGGAALRRQQDAPLRPQIPTAIVRVTSNPARGAQSGGPGA